MTVQRPRRRGQYAPLAARYYEDEAVMNAGPMAELLYVRGLAFCSGSMSDGFIGDAQVRAIGRDVRRLRSACASLVQWKLWKRDQSKGGYWVTSWLKWNPASEDIAAAREADRERKRGKHSTRNPGGQPAESGRRPPGIRSTDTNADADTDTESSDRTPAGPVRSEATGVHARTARNGAARPPDNPSWRELSERRKAAPPDFAALRQQLAQASAKVTTRPALKAPESDSGGST